jgi:hypothetical protein
VTDRTLALRTERLTELSTEELTLAVGAAAEVTGTGYLCVTQFPSCLNDTCQAAPR